MSDSYIAPEFEHVFLLKHVAHQPRILAHEQLAVLRGHDARGVLTAVLQHRQRIINALIDRAHPDHSDDSAHQEPPPPLGSDFDSGQALELRPRIALLADHGSKPIAERNQTLAGAEV